MFDRIKKRDDRVVEFDSSKITAAIARAGQATGEFEQREARKLTLRVLTLAHELRLGPIPEVEEIQDIVERVLLDSSFYRTAKAYILYREQHAQIRQIATKHSADLVNHYIRKLDWKVKENSNMSFSLQGLNNYISSDVTAEYWLNCIYPPEIRRAHKDGDFHIHDLSLLSVYCVGWDLQDLLRQGFKGVEGKVESAPPKHLRSALGQIVNFFYTLQGEAAGAQAISNFDTLLAPLIRFDGLDYPEIRQALQEFIFNINIPTRVGFQTPFTNITMDLYVPSILKDQPVIVGGRDQEDRPGAQDDEHRAAQRRQLASRVRNHEVLAGQHQTGQKRAGRDARRAEDAVITQGQRPVFWARLVRDQDHAGRVVDAGERAQAKHHDEQHAKPRDQPGQ